MWYIFSFALFGLVAGLVVRRWWAALVAPAFVVAFTLVWTAIESDLDQYGGHEFGPVATALLFAFCLFTGAALGVLIGRMFGKQRGLH